MMPNEVSGAKSRPSPAPMRIIGSATPAHRPHRHGFQEWFEVVSFDDPSGHHESSDTKPQEPPQPSRLVLRVLRWCGDYRNELEPVRLASIFPAAGELSADGK